jgi:hypothetical protein
MKILFLSLLAAVNLMAEAPGPKEHRGPKPTKEQHEQRLTIIKKYDVNKDGKLDKEERKNISEADRKLLRPPVPQRGKDKPKKD